MEPSDDVAAVVGELLAVGVGALLAEAPLPVLGREAVRRLRRVDVQEQLVLRGEGRGMVSERR